MATTIVIENPRATEIELEYAAITDSFKASFGHVFRLGELLLDAKNNAGFGKWEKWFDNNIKTFKIRQATNYISVFENRELLLNRQCAADLLPMNAMLRIISDSKPKTDKTNKKEAKPLPPVDNVPDAAGLIQQNMFIEDATIIEKETLSEPDPEPLKIKSKLTGIKHGTIDFSEYKHLREKAERVDALETDNNYLTGENFRLQADIVRLNDVIAGYKAKEQARRDKQNSQPARIAKNKTAAK